MKSVRLPRPICNDVERKICEFIGGNTEKQKVYLVLWDALTKTKEGGGLGLWSMVYETSKFCIFGQAWLVVKEGT